jgi:hypothetical protein
VIEKWQTRPKQIGTNALPLKSVPHLHATENSDALLETNTNCCRKLTTNMCNERGIRLADPASVTALAIKRTHRFE